MASTNINIDKLTRDVVMTVTVTKQFKFRVWIALKLVTAACWVMGCGIDVKEEKQPWQEIKDRLIDGFGFDEADK